MQKAKTPPIFFANITWMKNYDGLEKFEKAGADYVKKNKDAGEKHNFKITAGKRYGFVQCERNGKINIDKIAKRYGCEIKTAENNRYIEKALVIFFSTSPKGGAKIVGYYKNATIYESPLKNVQTNDEYYFVCDKDDGIIIDENERNFPIPKFEIKEGKRIYYFGQDQRMYAVDDKHLPLIKEVIYYITRGSLVVKKQENDTLSDEVRDGDIKAKFNESKLKGEIPTNNNREHNYSKRTKKEGASKKSAEKVRNGRKAEKYFLDYLSKKSFVRDKDFFDVANDEKYDYDVRFMNIGIEVKNIQTGHFYLTDSEIGCLERCETHLILIAIDNGIWLIKNDSSWLKDRIKDIKQIRKDCARKYTNIKLTDISINIACGDKKEMTDISQLGHDEIKNTLVGTIK